MTAGAKLPLNAVYQYGLQTLQLVQSGLQLRDTKLLLYILDQFAYKLQTSIFRDAWCGY